jgi:putative membrane protein
MNTSDWLHGLHIVGVILWVAGLTGVLALLQIHPNVEEKSRQQLTMAERRLAMVMDLGATLAIGFGLWMALRQHEFKNGAWLHVKLTAVVVGILTVHGMARVKIKRFRKGDLRPVPFAVWIALGAGVVTAAILGASHTLLRLGT